MDDWGFDLYYYGARFMDPVTGRFITPDPFRDYTNQYIYVGNNPVNRIDPDAIFIGRNPCGFDSFIEAQVGRPTNWRSG